MRVTTLRLALFTSLGVSLVACGDEASTPEPSEVRQGVTQNLSAVLPEVQAAMESDVTARVPTASVERIMDLLQPGSSESLLAQATDAKAWVSGAALDGDKLGGVLERHMFTDANHLDDGVYLVPASLVCATTFDPQTGEPGPLVDQDCAAALDRVDAKIRVRGDKDELKFTLLVGPNESEPVELMLSKKELSFHLDLGETQEVVADLARLYGEELPNVRVDGRVAVALEVLGTKHVELRAEIEDDLELAFAAEGVALDSAQAFRFSSQASKVYAVEIDAVDERLTASVDVGATLLHTPASSGVAERLLDLPGLSAAVTVERGEPVLLTDVSLGERDLTVTVDGQRAATVSLNAAAGRQVDITVTEGATDEVQLAFAPSFDLRMDVNDDLLGGDLALYQVTRVAVDGTNPTLSSRGDALRVVSGRLLVTTDPAQFGVEASIGQCVSKSLLGGLEVGPCTL
jgi:hypothetical protein